MMMNKILKSVQAELAASGLVMLNSDAEFYSDEQYFATHKKQLNYLFKICQKYFTPGAKFLDIGSSFGYPCLGAKLIGYETYGLDSASRVEKFAARFKYFAIENIVANLDRRKSPFSSRKFDVILVSYVPEDVDHNPTRFFNEITRLLKPGGILIITAKNLLRLNNLAKIFLGQGRRPKTKIRQNSEYYCEFTATDLAYLLKKNGLNIQDIKYRNFNSPGIAWLAKFLNVLSGWIVPHRKSSLVVTARK